MKKHVVIAGAVLVQHHVSLKNRLVNIVSILCMGCGGGGEGGVIHVYTGGTNEDSSIKQWNGV